MRSTGSTNTQFVMSRQSRLEKPPADVHSSPSPQTWRSKFTVRFDWKHAQWSVTAPTPSNGSSDSRMAGCSAERWRKRAEVAPIFASRRSLVHTLYHRQFTPRMGTTVPELVS